MLGEPFPPPLGHAVTLTPLRTTTLSTECTFIVVVRTCVELVARSTDVTAQPPWIDCHRPPTSRLKNTVCGGGGKGDRRQREERRDTHSLSARWRPQDDPTPPSIHHLITGPCTSTSAPVTAAYAVHLPSKVGLERGNLPTHTRDQADKQDAADCNKI